MSRSGDDAAVVLERPRRVVVMGRGGKTSLARAIGERFDLDFLELDSVAWLPNWEPRDRAERTTITERWLDDHPEGWVIDGDTADTSGAQLTERADTVVWLDLPFRTVFRRIVARTFRRVRSRTQVCGENYETWRTAVFSRNSLIYLHLMWLTNGRWMRGKRRSERLIDSLDGDQTAVRIRSAGQLNEFYDANGLTRPDN